MSATSRLNLALALLLLTGVLALLQVVARGAGGAALPAVAALLGLPLAVGLWRRSERVRIVAVVYSGLMLALTLVIVLVLVVSMLSMHGTALLSTWPLLAAVAVVVLLVLAWLAPLWLLTRPAVRALFVPAVADPVHGFNPEA
jgi:hypothetical protein